MKISVVTACFNSESTVSKTIDSFLAQTHLAKEMVIVDGVSKDRTLEIIAAYQSPQIRVISEPDLGVFDAMNKGLRAYTGDAVGFLNSDDTFHNSRVLTLIAEGLAHADIAYGDLLMVTDHETKTVVREWKTGRYTQRAFELGWQPPHPSFYMRKAVVDWIGEYDLQYRTTADYDLMLRALKAGFTSCYVEEVIADFQMGGLSTRDWHATWNGTVETLRSRRQNLGAPPIDAAVILRILRRLFQIRKFGNYWRS